MIQFERLHHVSLAVRNLETAKVFYSEVLRFQEPPRPPFASKGVWYAVGDQRLHLLEHPISDTRGSAESIRRTGISRSG